MRIILNFLFLLIAIPIQALASQQPPAVAVSLRFQTPTVTLHEPVLLSVEVRNNMTKPIIVNIGATVRQFYDLALTMPDGQVVHKDPFEGQVDIVTYGTGKATVEAGSQYTEVLVMNRWFSFSSEGTYSLVSKLTSLIETADGDFQPRSQTSKLLVKPRDTVKLTAVCADFSRQAEVATTVDAAQFPAQALSFVNDPIAVPFLAHLLSAHTLAYRYAITGLERIGTEDAIETLLSELKEQWADIPDLATASLARLQNRIANPRLKQAVITAVQRSSERARSDFIKTQIAYLDYESPQLQMAAIQNLTKVSGGLLQAEPVLQRLANDPRQPSEVTTAAKDALEQLHPPR